MRPKTPGSSWKNPICSSSRLAYPTNPNRTCCRRYWVIDGKRQLRFIRGDEETGTVVESRELLDVRVRLKHMDEIGTDIQVMYPTLFLMEATERPEVSTALRRSYNRWLADRCGRSGGRHGGFVFLLCRTLTKRSKSYASPKSMAPAVFSRRRSRSREMGRRSVFLSFLRGSGAA
jgi:hypothetical protein